MKKIITLFALAFSGYMATAQVKIGLPAGKPTSMLQVAGSFGTDYRVVTASTTIDSTYHTVLSNHTSGTITLTIPAPATCTGRQYVIQQNQAGGITNIATANGSGIESIEPFTLNQIGQTIVIVAGTSTWQLISNSVKSTVTPSGNIYTTDGTLAANRVVTMGNNNLTFNSTGGGFGIIGQGSGSSSITATNTTSNVNYMRLIAANGMETRIQNNGPNSIIGTFTNHDLFLQTGSRQPIAIKSATATPGLVGINTSAPTDTLDINGTVRVRNLPASLGTDSVVTADAATGQLHRRTIADLVNGSGITTNIYNGNGTLTGARTVTQAGNVLNFTGGNVGFGTGAPARHLHVLGTGSAASGSILVENTGALPAGQASVDFKSDGRYWRLINNATGDFNFFDNTAVITPLFIKGGTGNVGVGTTAPAAKLEVAGNTSINPSTLSTLPSIELVVGNSTSTAPRLLITNASTSIGSGTALGTLLFSGYDGGAVTPASTGQLPMVRSIATEPWTTTAHGSYLSLRTVPTGTLGSIEAMLVDQNGSVSVGGAGVPTATMDVNGTARVRTLPSATATDSVVTADASGNLHRRTINDLINGTPGVTTNIYNGDGTLAGNRTVTMGANNLNFTGTTGQLNVTGNTDGLMRTTFYNSNTGVNNRSDIKIGSGTGTTALYMGVDNAGAVFAGGVKNFIDSRNSTNRLAIGVNNNEYLSILNDGTIGIGTTAPTAKLEVNGTVKITDGTQGAGKILTSNATGAAAWQAAGQATYTQGANSFGLLVNANVTGGVAVATSGNYIYDVATVNAGGAYNTSTGVFTVPADGVYTINASTSLTYSKNAANPDLAVSLFYIQLKLTDAGGNSQLIKGTVAEMINGKTIPSGVTYAPPSVVNATVALKAGDKVELPVGSYGFPTVSSITTNPNRFSGLIITRVL